MILETSAIVAIFLREPGHKALLRHIETADVVAVGAPTLVEAGIVLSARTRRDVTDALALFVEAVDAEVLSFGDSHWRAAIRAWHDWGKGRHPAKLNLGDCLSYATARLAERPLLFKGDDFSQTDLETVSDE